MNDSRKAPWLSGLIAALSVAGWLLYEVAAGVLNLMSGALDTPMP